MSDRILMAMQMHAGDAAAGFSLLDLCCDLWEPLPVLAGLVLVIRHGVNVPADRMLRYEKMWAGGVHVHMVTASDTGWPRGCNVTVRSAWRFFLLTHFDALWLMEPDSVPTRSDFYSRVAHEWNARPRHKAVMGFWVQGPARDHAHINGNLVLSRRFAELCPEFLDGEMGDVPWDIRHKRELVKHGFASREIASVHGWGSSAKKPWTDPAMVFLPLTLPKHHPLGEQQEFSWLHGVKRATEAHAAVRAKFLRPAVVPANV